MTAPDPTAGEPWHWSDARVASPPAVAASTGTSEDVETLAEALWDAMPAHHVGWRGLNGQSREFYRGNAERLLASDWLATQRAAARAEERERIAQAIEAGRKSRPVGMSPTEHAAQIAREGR